MTGFAGGLRKMGKYTVKSVYRYCVEDAIDTNHVTVAGH
jgi:hypothetical protein